MGSKEYKYKFSVIIPVYNVENYLEETVESVIDQTIGFNDNIQMILVNDGSPDNSEAICLKYADMYKENIMYVKQENSGVSAARNTGLKYAEGKYINFLDSDDKWEKDVFKKAYDMFEKNPDVDIIGVRQKFFEALSNYPSLDFKFNKDKVVDIFNNYDHIQLSVTSGFVRESAIGNIRFDTRIKYSEDAKFLNEIIIKNCKLGIISSSVHLYRKRFSENSAIQTKNTKEDWYLITTELSYKYCFELSKKRFGYVIPYFQYYIAYDYQWRTKEYIPSSISKNVIEKFVKITKELLQDVEDYIIAEQKYMASEIKVELLSLKYGRKINKELNYIQHALYFNNKRIINLENEYLFQINSIEYKDDILYITGNTNYCLPDEDYKINVIINKTKRIPILLKDTNVNVRKIFGKEFIHNKGFKIEIPIKDVKNIRFEFVYKEFNRTYIRFITTINTKLSTKVHSYYANSDKLFYINKYRIIVKKNSTRNRIHFSLRFIKDLIQKRQFKVMLYRLMYHIEKPFNRKEIWLVSDRANIANDNGEHLFRYINSIKDDKIKTYFVISKKSKDYERMKKYGRVVNLNSPKYKVLYLLSSKMISSQADDWILNPFGKRKNYYQDLYNRKFIFLQHGITKDDLSPWLNTYTKKIDLFITAALPEYNSFINETYGFDKNNVLLTGFPRYDNLYDNRKNVIAIMPTWRAMLAGKDNPITKEKNYNENFKNSEYFKFYNKLINDQDIIKLMEENGYKGVFVLHPGHHKNMKDFDTNDTFEFKSEHVDYQGIFAEAKLLITDYSSVAFDFAYLRKPIIYTQFDKDEFFDEQLYNKGYYSYEKDGFGDVLYNYTETKKAIMKIIKNGCKMDKKYENRIDKFYKYNDKNNCKRVYEAIKGIDSNEK